MEQTVTDLVNRVNRLETQQRRWRLFALLAMVAAIGIVWTDRNPMPAATDVVTARKFVVLNEAGDVAADLGLVDHLPALTFRGPLEQTLGRLTSRELLMQDAGPEPVQRVRLNDTGLAIRGRRTTQVKEEPLFNLSVEAGPSLSMIGESSYFELLSGKSHIRMRSGDGNFGPDAFRGPGAPSLDMTDAFGKSLVLGDYVTTSGRSGDVQQIAMTGANSLSLLDRTGSPRLQLLGDIYPGLHILDESGKRRMLVGNITPFVPESPGVTYAAAVLDQSMKPIWRAP